LLNNVCRILEACCVGGEREREREKGGEREKIELFRMRELRFTIRGMSV